MGDYTYAAATNTYGVAVWNDVRGATDCPVVDAYRQALTTANPTEKPFPGTQCSFGFGNTDIYSYNSPAIP